MDVKQKLLTLSLVERAFTAERDGEVKDVLKAQMARMVAEINVFCDSLPSLKAKSKKKAKKRK